MTTTNWTDGAACRYVDPELFFRPDFARNKHWEAAREVCRGCPVSVACLEYAIETRDEHAMLAGLTPEERRPLLPQVAPSMRYPIQHGTVGGEKAHRRRGEKPCTACTRAYNIARRIREDRAKGNAA